MMAATVLVVDDEEFIVKLVRKALQPDRYILTSASNGREALERLAETPADVAIVDLRMPGMDGLTLLERIRADHPGVDAIVLTAHGDLEAADQAMQRGAVGFVSKPFDAEALRERVARLARLKTLQRENRDLRAALAAPRTLVTRDPTMAGVLRAVERVAPDDATVLIVGESGTGKELVARAIHQAGPRREEPFLPVDCAAISPSVIESELFGHVRGAFTGADRDRTGLLRLAGRGTVFLDEISEMPPPLQAKLLRAIQEREVRPVGGSVYEPFEGRVVCATNRDLAARVKEGGFREDLYYRINVVTLTLPPLRERPADIEPLAEHFIEQLNRRKGATKRLGAETFKALSAHHWPGNVRELQNSLECAWVFCTGDEIEPEHLPQSVRRNEAGTADPRSLDGWICRGIVDALRLTRGNVAAAARSLGIAKTTLYRYLKNFNLDPEKLSR